MSPLFRMNRIYRLGAALAVVVVLVFSLTLPVQAFSSLNGCLKNPACAKQLAAHSSVGAPITPAGLAASSSAPAAAPAASRIFLPNPGDILGVGAGIAGLVFPWSPEQAEEAAAPYLPVEGPGQCPTQYIGTVTTQQYRSDGTVNGAPSVRTFNRLLGPVSVTGSGTNAIVVQGANSSQNVAGTGGGFYFEVTDFSPERFDGLPDDCTGDPELQPEDEPTHLPDLFGTPQPLPYPPPVPDFGPDGLEGTDDDGEPSYPPLELSGSSEEPTIWIDPAGLGAPWIESPSLIPNPEVEPNWNGQPGSDGQPGGDGQDAPDITPLLEGEAPLDNPIEPATFNKPHFFLHAMAVFSTKFPLDIVGEMPDEPQNVCPVFSFLGEEFELCIIRDALDALQIPAILSFIIWALLTL